MTVAVALALVAAAVLLIGKAAGYARLGIALRHADPRWFVACALGEVAAYLGYILGYRNVVAVENGPRLRLRTVTEIVALGFGAFLVASAGGPAVDYWALHRAGLSVDGAIRRVLALNTVKFLALAATTTAVAADAVARGIRVSSVLTVPWLVVVPVCVVLAIVLGQLVSAGRLHPVRPVERRGRPHCFREFEHWLVYLVREGLWDAIAGVLLVRRLLLAPAANAGSTVGWPLYWAGDLLCLYGGIRSFGGHVGFTTLVLGYAGGYAVSIVPLPLGGTGGFEAAMTFALHLAGAPLAPALLGVTAYRFFNFWLPILPAFALLPALRRLPQQLADAALRGDRGEAMPAMRRAARERS